MRSKWPTRVLIVVLTLVLAVSVAVNYYLLNFSRRYYDLFNRTRLNPLGLNAFTSNHVEKQDSDSVNVVFFGDSRVAEWPLPNVDGFDFVNRGINSHTSNQLLLRYDAHIRPLNPHILFVQVCINDLFSIPLNAESSEAIIIGCKNNIQQIVRDARGQDATVILSTIFPVGRVPIESRLFWSDEILLAVEEVNSFIKSLEGDGVVVFDTFSILANDEGRLLQEFSRDMLHLNSAGYEEINREFIPLLKSLNE